MSGIQQWESIGDDITREHIAVTMMKRQYKFHAKNGIQPTAQTLARLSVEYADALIAELKRRKEPQQ